MDQTLWYIQKIYYDSSLGTIELGNRLLSELFQITVGVKQGGILSPPLFENKIDDLIYECINENIGAQINNINICIIVYADDILLLSPVDSHLQRLLDICDAFSKFWRIKFNAKKSNIIEFGPQFFENTTFFINKNEISKVDEITYLGVKINKNLNFNEKAIEKFTEVQKSIFSLSFLGL